MPQKVRSKKIQADNFACPDMVIFAARKGYHGMFLELKAETPFRKDGALKTDPHLARQDEAIEGLMDGNYHAHFYWDFDTAKDTIDWYLKDAR